MLQDTNRTPDSTQEPQMTTKKKASKKRRATEPSKSIVYAIDKPEVTIVRCEVEIAGDLLLCDRLTTAAIAGYGETAVAGGKIKKLPKTPEEVGMRARYLDDDGNDAFPASGVRACIRDAAVQFERKEVSKAGFNRSVVVRGNMLPLTFDSVEIKEHIGRNSGATRAPRLVYRPEYKNWKLAFEIDLLLNSLNPTQLYSLIDMAGRCIGIGNWRPGTAKGGSHGTFTIEKFEVRGE